MRADTYQILLIIAGVLVAALFGVFLYREIFPEYKIYQNDYMALEAFRSTYTHQSPPPFQTGIKQIVLEREDHGPPTIDRCVSCHVALQVPYFSPTKIAYDPNGNMMRDQKGKPVLIPNEDYIWQKLDQKIAELRDEKVLEQLKNQGEHEEIKRRLNEADKYETLKTAHVGDQVYDVTKVLAMHPLMGNETYPFQYHPLEEYGCTSCHNGNGRGLTTDKAHGPVFDGQYEIEDLGPTPHFTESDPKHDPLFARVFNHKPGSELIFQTEPIFVGALIQAKCVQCHQTSDIKLSEVDSSVSDLSALRPQQQAKPLTDINELTQDYQRGRELYISQACYACHRIAGFSRGGVGPELTRAGENYPWYLKRKLVWPQGDLSTSTMPNMHFDSKEIEDIMTFLLAQKGPNRAIAKTHYQVMLQAWEVGKKTPLEKPIPPAQMYDLRHSMTIFATQGCAACHRLQGFESNVGFAVEKDSPSFEKLYEQQRWFRKLFPEVVHFSYYDEELPGSEIVSKIEQNAKEIDERILNHVRQNGILEEIDRNHPEVLESLYSPFRYAARAKNDQAWKERVHRVLMMYIQIYGLGRLIGPHLNWSGIYRTDEWLMEHFHNPASHVPRSLMPVFPFDDTKFYALTHMLDVLAVRNRNAIRQIWDQRGFDPIEAYEMLCAQCHGIGMVGNGVIAEWIYPIPKNLHNPDFLRNLTKDKAVDSIMHGVKGTPMPPWSEVAADKPVNIQKVSHHIPVLKEAEVNYLVDWIFTALPGGEVIRRSSDVPKWQYMPADVLKELEKERGKLNPLTSEERQVEDIFDVDTEQKNYYIKKKFYTPENIEEGQKFFLINCAVCHGSEGEGSGVRAQAMQEAKPRMFTNLDWINSRDDLRLLQSIKYGVPGTAMTPWGDFTNSLQRLQLVIFIRSLTTEQGHRSHLFQALYQTFEMAQLTIENARLDGSKQLNQLQKELEHLHLQQDNLERKIAEGKGQPQDVLSIYQQILELERKVANLQEQDQKLADLKAKLKIERDLYYNLGISLMSKDLPEPILQHYFDLIHLNANRYALQGQQLVIHQRMNEQIRSMRQVIVDEIDKKINALEQQRKMIEGRIFSAQQREELNAVKANIESYKKMKAKLMADTEEALRLAEEQAQIVEALKDKRP